MVEFNSNYMYLYMSTITKCNVLWQLALLFDFYYYLLRYMQLHITPEPHCVKLAVQSHYVRHFDFLSLYTAGKLKKKQNKLNPKPPKKFNIYTSLNKKIQRQCVYHIVHKSYNYQINLWPQLILLICEVLVHLMRRYFC